MPRRIDAGELLAALGGLLVIVALFLDWFEGGSGWEVFEALDLVLAALAAAAVWIAASSALGARPALPPRALPLIGAALLFVVVVQLIEPPPVFSAIDPDREAGVWLALAGGLLVLLGGLLRAARISVTVSVGQKDTRRRVPAVDRRPGSAPASAPAPDAAVRLGTAPESGAAGGVAAAGEAARRTSDEPDQATQPFVPASDAAPEEER